MQSFCVYVHSICVRAMVSSPDFSQGVPLCDVFVHGSGECEQLGLGDGVLERKKPTLVKSLIDAQIVAIAVGSLHNLALTVDGQVYSWGCNDEGALGRVGEENVPMLIPGLAGIPIRSVSVGDCHSVFLDYSGRVWLCGTYKDSSGHLGFPDFAKGIGHVHHKSMEPVLVSGLPPKTRVEEISSGANHTIVLVSSTDKRRSSQLGFRVMAWGNDEFGQLGLGREEEEGRPEEDTVMLKHTRRGKRHQKAKLFPRDCAIGPAMGCWASAQGSFLRLGDGSILGCGLNNFGQLGMGVTSPFPVRLFVRITPLSEMGSIAWIGGGTVHSAARTEDGRVYTWGRRDYCGLPAGGGDVQPPLPVSLPPVRRVSCGGSHTLAATQDGCVYAWGFGGTNQLGNLPRDVSLGAPPPDEMPEDEAEPYLMDSKQLAARYVIAVGAGAQHSVELAWTPDTYVPDLAAQLSEMCVRTTPKRKSGGIYSEAKRHRQLLLE